MSETSDKRETKMELSIGSKLKVLIVQYYEKCGQRFQLWHVVGTGTAYRCPCDDLVGRQKAPCRCLKKPTDPVIKKELVWEIDYDGPLLSPSEAFQRYQDRIKSRGISFDSKRCFVLPEVSGAEVDYYQFVLYQPTIEELLNA